ncbi:MAG: hypothetical protein NUV97_03935 [archaeon]|nr:hypothetical protein [archaeon]MCR4323831.1 hypothetical protein [Nanoarchaeota archaeon]
MAELKLMGSRITKVNGERVEDFDGKLEIKTNIHIISVEKIKEAKDTLKVKYGFGINYGGLGNVSIEGLLFISSDQKTLKDIQKNINSQKVESKEQIILMNSIFQRASVRAIEIEEELGLPIHIRLPSFDIKE